MAPLSGLSRARRDRDRGAPISGPPRGSRSVEDYATVAGSGYIASSFALSASRSPFRMSFWRRHLASTRMAPVHSRLGAERTPEEWNALVGLQPQALLLATLSHHRSYGKIPSV